MTGPFHCVEAGSETASGGQTKKQVINMHVYCITKETQGAAGSIYSQYAYAAQKDGKVVIFTFSMRESQCANYDDAEKLACETERNAFSIDNVLDRIAGSVQVF
jgi:hypothetical protein